MLLSVLELIISLSCLLEQDRPHVTAANIMLGKASRQSSTYKQLISHAASLANDGNVNTIAITHHQLQPFWQGDLQGFYTVHNITIRRSAFRNIRNAYIGVSSVDVDCPNDDVIWCGQWPDVEVELEVALTFNCSHALPVRFVRVWRNTTYYLTLYEVEVEGTLRRQNAAMYHKSRNTKLTQTVTSVNAVSVNDCAVKCLINQPCVVFSYNPSVQLPCVFATSTATTATIGWGTYSIPTCFKDITTATYDSLNTKLIRTVTSVNAISANDCSICCIKCHKNQPCLAFS